MLLTNLKKGDSLTFKTDLFNRNWTLVVQRVDSAKQEEFPKVGSPKAILSVLASFGIFAKSVKLPAAQVDMGIQAFTVYSLEETEQKVESVASEEPIFNCVVA